MLLLATMINYMDRQTLANLAVRITDEFQLSDEQYGDLEVVFGISFACGSLVWGYLADAMPVRILYPLVLLAWSAVGFATGLTTGYSSLFYCRALLGFFESGHWPCALVVTHAILSSSDRPLGNSILQSGASLGAILTPLIITALVAANTEPNAWRPPFLIIGGVGVIWVLLWSLVMRGGKIAQPYASSRRRAALESAAANTPAPNTPAELAAGSGPAQSSERQELKLPGAAIGNPYEPPSRESAVYEPAVYEPPVFESASSTQSDRAWLVSLFFNRRFWAMLLMVLSINTTWQLIRAWLPKFLQEGRGYAETTTWLFNSAYYISTDVGCLLAGAAALWLARGGMTAHGSRLVVYGVCACISALTCVAAILPASPLLLAILLVVGAGTLGLFPCYYSFTQEVSAAHVGKITGVLSFLGWLIPSPIHRYFGRYVDTYHSFDLGIAIVGLAPLIGLFAMLVLWPRQADAPDVAEPMPAPAEA